MTGRLTTSVKGCARCGEDHDRLTFDRMSQPVTDEDGTEWPWWASCPKTGDPVLLREVEEEA